MKKFWMALLFLIPFLALSASKPVSVQISESDFLEFKVGNYVHGFKEFDTSVMVVDKTISVGIYWDRKSQDGSRAVQLKKRFEDQIPHMIGKYNWAKHYKSPLTHIVRIGQAEVTNVLD